MSGLLPYELGEDFKAAIQQSLPGGELLRAVSDGFTWETRNMMDWKKDLVPTSYVTAAFTVAITNVALRAVTFKNVQALSPRQEEEKARLKKKYLLKGKSEDEAERKATGIFGVGAPELSVAVPEILSSTSYQISDISAIQYAEGNAAPWVQKWAGPHIAEVSWMTFSCHGTALQIGSIFNNFVDVYRHLEAAKSGAAIASTITSIEASLSRLKSLFDDGVITGAEFDQAKSAFVGTAADVPESAASSLRQLNGLYTSGILSEAEYRAKKFEVLSRLGH